MKNNKAQLQNYLFTHLHGNCQHYILSHKPKKGQKIPDKMSNTFNNIISKHIDSM